MKLQIEGQHCRIRIDEDELARLLSGDALRAQTQFAGAFAVDFEASLSNADAAGITGEANHWTFFLPAAAVRELAARLPSRDGLRFVLPGSSAADALTVLFDVDVRDSVKRRRSS